MRLLERQISRIDEILDDLPLDELAGHQITIINRAKSRIPKLVEHLMLLYYYRANPSADHWVHEVYAFLSEIPDTKTRSGHINGDYLEHNLLGPINANFANGVYRKAWGEIKRREQGLDFWKIERNPQKDKAQSFCRDYIKWLSSEISVYSHVTLPAVRLRVNLLWKNYPYR